MRSVGLRRFCAEPEIILSDSTSCLSPIVMEVFELLPLDVTLTADIDEALTPETDTVVLSNVMLSLLNGVLEAEMSWPSSISMMSRTSTRFRTSCGAVGSGLDSTLGVQYVMHAGLSPGRS